MDTEKATQLIIEALGKHHTREQIILDLCEKMGLNWSEAEQLVQEVEEEHGREIAARKSPLLLLVGAGIFLAGGWLAFNGASEIVRFFLSQGNGLTLEAALQVQVLYVQAGALLAGLGMMVGALVGSWQALTDLLTR